MQDIWTRIEAWLDRNAPGVLTSLRPGATSEDLRELESRLGVDLPGDVRDSYRIHDGQGEAEVGSIEGWEMLSLSNIVVEWRVWKELHDRGVFSQSRSAPVGPIVTDWWNTKWIPLTRDGSGNHHCLDLAPDLGGIEGQIITMWHDEPLREVLAPNYRAWLERFADELEQGEYVLREDYGGLVRKDDV